MISRRTFWKGLITAAVASYAVAGGSTAEGAGFALMEQSAKELGSAFAGGAAAAEDAGTIFFNPAGLSRLPGRQLVLGGHLILPEAHFHNEGSSYRGAPLSGGEGGNAVNVIGFPALYYSQQLNGRVHLGLGVFSPFGLSTRYDDDWVGRYHAVKSELVTLNINPCVAYRVNDHLSVGGGIDIQYARAKLSNAVDFGPILAAQGVLGFTPQSADGFATLRGDSWSWGGNAGILYRFTDGTRAGVAYRSRIEHRLRGTAHFSNVPVPIPAFRDSAATADATFPESVSASIWHNLTEELAATADFTWTHWSSFHELRVHFDNALQPDAVTTTRWRNTWRYAAGLVYTPGPWTLRTGVAYDPSPVPDAELRTPRIPDNDRLWIAAGFGCRFNRHLSADLGYAHIFVKDPVIAKPAGGENALRGALVGTYTGEVDILGAQLAWNF